MTACYSWLWQVKTFPCLGLVFSKPGIENTSWLHPIIDLLHPADFWCCRKSVSLCRSQIHNLLLRAKDYHAWRKLCYWGNHFSRVYLHQQFDLFHFHSPRKKKEINIQGHNCFCSKSTLNLVDYLGSDYKICPLNTVFSCESQTSVECL